MVSSRTESHFRRFTAVVIFGISSLSFFFYLYLDSKFSSKNFFPDYHIINLEDIIRSSTSPKSESHEASDFLQSGGAAQKKNSNLIRKNIDIPFTLPFFTIESITSHFNQAPWAKNSPIISNNDDKKLPSILNISIDDDVTNVSNYVSSVSTNEESREANRSQIQFGSLLTPPLPWTQIMDIPALKLKSKTKVVLPEILSSHLHVCPKAIVTALAAGLSESDMKWCQWAIKEGKVVIGKSWGSLDAKQRVRYEALGCNSIAKGKNPSCDDGWGDAKIINWLNNNVYNKSDATALCPKNSISKVNCYDSDATNRVCYFENVMVDFKKMSKVERPGKSNSRKWEKGFLSADCGAGSQGQRQGQGQGQGKDIENYWPGYSPELLDRDNARCDYVFDETVIIYSHDELRNLGHTMQDLMNAWLLTVLSGQAGSSEDITLLNLDALRLYNNYDDKPSPFFRHHELMFHRILRGIDYLGKTLCFKRLLMQPKPVVMFVWDGWESDMPCTKIGPSSLFQRWNIITRINYHSPSLFPNATAPSTTTAAAAGLPPSLRSPVHVLRLLLVIREGRGGDGATHPIRFIRNLQEVTALLQSLENVHVIVKDLGTMSFEKQVQLVSTCHLMIGMHGAGLAHLTHMPLGSDHCCGLLELFPQSEWTPARGHGNMARRLGLHYDRIDFVSATGSGAPSEVPIVPLKEKLGAMIASMRQTPSCILPQVLEDLYLRRNVPIIWST